jgi:hypothetical protein
MSFLALKTHFDPIMFAPAGASSSCHVPMAFKVTSSSSIVHSHSSHLGLRLASVGMHGSSASVLAVSAAKACLGPLKSSSNSGMPLATAHAPPASSASLVNDLGTCRPGVSAGLVLCAKVMPSPECKSYTRCEGFQRHADCCGGAGWLAVGVASISSVEGCAGVEGVLGVADYLLLMVGIVLSSPLSCADVPK